MAYVHTSSGSRMILHKSNETRIIILTGEAAMTTIQKAIKRQAHQKLMPMLERELPRLEALLPQCPPESPDYPPLVRALTVMYGQLNRLLATACLEMGYPLRQEQWKDSQPLTAVAETFPMVETTEWFQLQLASVVMAPAEPHPWTDLVAFEGEISTSATSPQSA